MAEVESSHNLQNGSLGTEKAALNGTHSPSHTPYGTSRAASFLSSTSNLHSSDTPASSAKSTFGDDWKPPTDEPLKVPFPQPLASCKPVPAAKLTAEQETKYENVLSTVSQWQTIPATTAKNAAQEPIQDDERMFLTRECILRYLRATKWNTGNAVKRLQNTLSWRREYGADGFTADYISPENETGKQLQLGFDKYARPCLYLSPGRQNTKMSDRQIHHLSYMLDRTIDMMPPGVENTTLIINFKNAASGNVPTVGQGRAVLQILQTHNPERLGRALISETPWYVNTFFKLISPFIDPVTREKMKFNEDLKNYIPAEQLWNSHGGNINFQYDHGVYWPAFTELCQQRRQAFRERWTKAGKQVGEYEEYLRGGDHPSLMQMIETKKANGNSTPASQET